MDSDEAEKRIAAAEAYLKAAGQERLWMGLLKTRLWLKGESVSGTKDEPPAQGIVTEGDWVPTKGGYNAFVWQVVGPGAESEYVGVVEMSDGFGYPIQWYFDGTVTHGNPNMGEVPLEDLKLDWQTWRANL